MALITGLESAEGILLARNEGGSWIALDTVAGREQWTWPYAESTGPSEDPTFVGAAQGRLFFNSGSDLTVLDASDGNVIATYKDVGEVQVVPEHKLLLGRESAGPPPTARSCGP